MPLRVFSSFKFTSLHFFFQSKRQNSLKDFVAVAGPLGVSHMLVFTRTELSVILRLIRVPHGPTLTFKGNCGTSNWDHIPSVTLKLCQPIWRRAGLTKG